MHTIRFLIFIHLVALPIACLWFFSERILLLAQVPSTDLAAHAGSVLRCLLIGIPGYASFEAGKRFLQAQGNFAGGFYVLLICVPIQGLLAWALVQRTGMRVAGAALSASITTLIRPVFLAAYVIYVNPSTLLCWPDADRIRREWKSEWKTMVCLAIPGALMSLSEWLCFELLTFCVSYVGTTSLAAQTFLSTTAVTLWHVPLSASIAFSTRLGQLIGAGLVASLQRIMKWYMLLFVSIGVLDSLLSCGIILLMLRFLVNDAAVAAIAKRALPWVAGFVVFDATSNWPHGVIRGFGWQGLGAWVTLTVNYLYAVPLSFLLELGPPRMGIQGLWAGLGSGLALIILIESLAAWRRLKKLERSCGNAVSR